MNGMKRKNKFDIFQTEWDYGKNELSNKNENSKRIPESHKKSVIILIEAHIQRENNKGSQYEQTIKQRNNWWVFIKDYTSEYIVRVFVCGMYACASMNFWIHIFITLQRQNRLVHFKVTKSDWTKWERCHHEEILSQKDQVCDAIVADFSELSAGSCRWEITFSFQSFVYNLEAQDILQ